MSELIVTEIQIHPIPPRNGHVAFASVVINQQFYLGNIAVYTAPRTPLGFRLVFPNKKLASGQVVDCFHPITKEAGEQISEAIIKKYQELMDNFDNIDVV